MKDRLTSKEVAERLKVHPSTITRMVQRGDLKAVVDWPTLRLFDADYIELFAATYAPPKPGPKPGPKPARREVAA
jgi:excisionase family DNA binding protein